MKLDMIRKNSLVRDAVLVLVQDPPELVLPQRLVPLVQLPVGVTDVLCQCQLPVTVSIMLLHHLLNKLWLSINKLKYIRLRLSCEVSQVS